MLSQIAGRNARIGDQRSLTSGLLALVKYQAIFEADALATAEVDGLLLQ